MCGGGLEMALAPSVAIEHKAVAALVGRRIDADGTSVPQFPLGMVPAVRKALDQLLREERVNLLICSAACGADLLALDVALNAGIRCRVILPFDQTRFRQTSVTDRPGNWGLLFDRIISVVKSKGDLVVLNGQQTPEQAYSEANKEIIHEIMHAPGVRRLAIIVWEGHPRTTDDATAQFQRLAQSAGLLERIVPTI